MRYLQLITVFLLFIATGCGNKNENKTEIIQKHRGKIVNVSDKINDIKTDAFFGKSSLHIIDDILIAEEFYPKGEKVDHLLNKNTFKYITSTGILGRGPGEICVPSGLLIDQESRFFWQLDVGKRMWHKFPIDSVLSDNMFKPTVSVKLSDKLLLVHYDFLNDSIVLGKAIEPFSGSPFVTMAMTKFNINTGEIGRFGYENPKVVGKWTNSYFALSEENGIYVNCYLHKDLMTICDLSGNLKYNVYGPGWNDQEKDENGYFYDVKIYSNKIFASYLGSCSYIIKGNIERGAYPNKILLFGLDGSYLKTIETGSEFCSFCIDEKNNRIIAYFDDREEPLGYFDIGSDI